MHDASLLPGICMLDSFLVRHRGVIERSTLETGHMLNGQASSLITIIAAVYKGSRSFSHVILINDFSVQCVSLICVQSFVDMDSEDMLLALMSMA